ncbi:TIGR00341 family protein [bacterium]|nr:TIGR00341 family protein [bacterium]
MGLRLIEFYGPHELLPALENFLEENEYINTWKDSLHKGEIRLKILVDTSESVELLDQLEKNFSAMKNVRIIILKVEAVIPTLKKQKPKAEIKPAETQEVLESEIEENSTEKIDRISRVELYTAVEEAATFNNTWLTMLVLSTIVAFIGLLRNNVAVIIGAMVIAPLLGPNVGLALATTLADSKLAKKSVKTLLTGIIIASVFAISLGLFFNPDPSIAEIKARTQVSISDIVLALASGCAGVLAFTTGASSVLIGVMVAVAMLPPLVTMGMLLGSGSLSASFGAAMLFAVNLIALNLAGVVTFHIKGIKPLSWWEKDKAHKAWRNAIILWSILLIILIGIISLMNYLNMLA